MRRGGSMTKKTAVVFTSVSGFTKSYAEWIADTLDADIFPAHAADFGMLSNYSIIIYGGPLHAVGIAGIGIVRKLLRLHSGVKIIVFATGASPSTTAIPETVLNKNFSKEEQSEIKFFYFRGGFDFRRLSPLLKIVMTLFKWKLMRTENPTDDENGMLAAYTNPVDFTARSSIKPLVTYVRALEKPRGGKNKPADRKRIHGR